MSKIILFEGKDVIYEMDKKGAQMYLIPYGDVNRIR
jgi:hypothetical protein